MILFFFLGVLASLVRSDLEIPRDVSKGLSLYLLIALGFKGGVELNHAGITPQVVTATLVAAALSLLFPLVAFAFLRRVTDSTNAAAIAAHYGSVSAVTFVTATAFLGALSVDHEPYMVALLAVMESPAIVTGLFLARRYAGAKAQTTSLLAHPLGIPAALGQASGFGLGLDRELLREVFLNSSIVLITGSLVIGSLTGESGMSIVKPVLEDPFKGLLGIFLLDMGLAAGRGLGEFRKLGLPLTLFGLLMPLFGGVIGSIAGALIDLSVGGTTLLAVLAASASYIAVPAAMRIALPAANPSLYLTMSLGITFPFNVMFGIPIYFYLARLTTALL